MKFCSHCGKEIMDDAVICCNCGCAVANTDAVIDPDDAPNLGFAVLGFFIPIVGLILYLVYMKKSPLKAKSAGKGALIGYCIKLAIYVILYLLTSIITGASIASVLNSVINA